MAEPIIMPKAGMLMHTGTILEWYASEGVPIRKGDTIAYIETDKATMNLEAEYEGVLLKIVHGPGEVVPVTRPIAWVGDPGEPIPDTHHTVSKTPVNLGLTIPLKILQEEKLSQDDYPDYPDYPAGKILENYLPAEHHSGTVRATPAARRTAAEFGVALREISPSGRHWQILASDVLHHINQRHEQENLIPIIEEEEGDSFLTLTSTQKTMARHLSFSVQTIPYSSCSMDADVTSLIEKREQMVKTGNKVTITAFAVAALAFGLRKNRRFNSQYDRDRLILKGAVNIGIAVNGPQGLVVPVLPHADQLTIEEISSKTAELSNLVNTESVGPELLEGATITLSNLGPYGVTSFIPLINPPQSAILGVSAVRDMFLPDPEGNPVLKKVMGLTLSYDHRVGGGAEAALLLAGIREALEHPDLLKPQE
jgi:pyruvate dehydrogenase E2 component (dihydrolipoamide acetyltransferase)